MSEECWITGVGLHTALGDGRATLESLNEGTTAVAPFAPPGAPGVPTVLGAPCAPFDLRNQLPDPKMLKYMSPGTQLAVLAAGRALDDAGLRGDATRLEDAALLVTTGTIAFDFRTMSRAMEGCAAAAGAADVARLGAATLTHIHPLMPFKMLLNMPLGLISIVYGIKGENLVNYPSADQGGIALATAWHGVRDGRFPLAVVGGCVQGLSLVPLLTLDRLGRVARPDTAEPSGWPLTDAAAFLVLESTSAARRDHRPLARLEWVGLGPPLAAGPEEVARALTVASPTSAPDVVLSTGTLNPGEERRLDDALGAAWPGNPPPRLSFDALMGYAGAAAVACTAGLGSCLLTRGRTPAWSEASSLRQLLVCASAPDESTVIIRLEAGP